MLIVELLNTTHESAISDYRASVRVNHRVIWEGHVTGHHRSDGWGVLLIKLVYQAFVVKR